MREPVVLLARFWRINNTEEAALSSRKLSKPQPLEARWAESGMDISPLPACREREPQPSAQTIRRTPAGRHSKVADQ